MRVTFVHHSCFAVEIEDTVLIFDYFDGDRVNGFHFTGKLPEYPADQKIYMFVSHKHQDHFDMDIFKLADQYENIHYIISKDAKMSRNFLKKHGYDADRLKEKITYVSAVNDYTVDELKIHTLRSTDAGVAFAVEVCGKLIYHAGDLNWWQMEGAGDIINGKSEREYKHQLKYFDNKIVNLAFVVLDPRLKDDGYLGFDYFMKHVMADHVFPMHMWQHYGMITGYKKRSDNTAFTGRIMEIREENQVFDFIPKDFVPEA